MSIIFDGNGPFKGAKTNFYEGGIRTPMLVRWPGKIKAGTQSEFVGYFRRCDADGGGAGRREPSFAQAARRHLVCAHAAGPPDEQKTHEYLYWEAAGQKQDITQQAVRWGNWKAVRNRGADAFELYDLAKDIGEEHECRRAEPRGHAEDRRDLPRGAHAGAGV